MTNKIKGNVLVYSRRQYNFFFKELAERTFEGEITLCTDWPSDLPNMGFLNFMPDFYESYNESLFSSSLSEPDLQQIVARCRVLRLLPKEQAVKMVYAMEKVVKSLIDRYKPDYFLSRTVDNYIIDIFCRTCAKRDIKVVTFVNGCIKDTINTANYGEFNKVRQPSEAEVKNALEVLLDDSTCFTYGLKLSTYSFHKHLKEFFIWQAKYLAFKLLAIVYRDPLNFRFLATFLRAESRERSSLSNYKASQYYDLDWNEKLNGRTLPILYIPLGYTPECTTDYWLKDLRYVDYENFIVDLCKKLNQNYLLLVKDHWAMRGARDYTFYKELKDIPGVVLVPSHVNGREILQLVERVLLGAGTTGVEAAVRGKKVVTLGVPYYYVKGHYLPLKSADEVEGLSSTLEVFSPPPLTQENQEKLVSKLLESTLIGNAGVSSTLNTEENLTTTSESLKFYLSSA